MDREHRRLVNSARAERYLLGQRLFPSYPDVSQSGCNLFRPGLCRRTTPYHPPATTDRTIAMAIQMPFGAESWKICDNIGTVSAPAKLAAARAPTIQNTRWRRSKSGVDTSDEGCHVN